MKSKIKIYTYTWNMNFVLSLNTALAKLYNHVKNRDYDLIILSFQEFSIFTDISSIKYYFKNYNMHAKISSGLYTVILSRIKVEIDIYLKKVYYFLRYPKGFIATSIKIMHGPHLVHINCHLIADEINHSERINEFIKMIKFLKHWKLDCNYIFLTGDFNFRMTKKCLNYSLGYKYDQATELFKIYSALIEAPIKFKPTYKYLNGSNDYISNRIPSWCDRILLFSCTNDIKLNNYKPYNNVLDSDHKPVGCSIIIKNKFNSFLNILENFSKSEKISIIGSILTYIKSCMYYFKVLWLNDF
ncbi:Type IV inositol polyphosphate 5-phosphatase 11 [Astathelohania contejeani]|uniref:Type IV inositol polyphosphate 5-phosphatase 11 n=1 Tax=Astathelohania contejeani TaxID=164912 RepID=A0ABQ7I0A0_9MICR|nr:Type IV inositol polyphosphate 5-phosphatase 11 [Thelohania contejeani]